MAELDTYYKMLEGYTCPKHLSDAQLYTLQKMTTVGFISAYSLEKLLRGTQYSMKYVNVRKLLLDLLEKGLIRQVEVEYEGKHPDVKCYVVSDAGLHYLFSEGRGVNICNLKRFYGDSIIFKMLLTKIFTPETMEKSTGLLDIVLQQYVHAITHYAERLLQNIKETDSKKRAFYFAARVDQFAFIMVISLLRDISLLDKETKAIVNQDPTFKALLVEVKEVVGALVEAL